MSPIRLSSAVNFGHPSSVTVNFSNDSSSGGTLGCVVKGGFCTKFLFCCFVFHSHLPDYLSHFSPVERGPSAYNMPSSRCSVGCALRSDIIREGWFFCQFLFPTTSVLNSLWLAAFPAPLFMDARMGGVVPRVYLEGIFCIPRGMPRQQPTWPFLGPLACRLTSTSII